MTNRDLIEAMNGIDPALILEADPSLPVKKKPSEAVRKWMGFAACFLLILGLGSMIPMTFLTDGGSSFEAEESVPSETTETDSDGHEITAEKSTIDRNSGSESSFDAHPFESQSSDVQPFDSVPSHSESYETEFEQTEPYVSMEETKHVLPDSAGESDWNVESVVESYVESEAESCAYQPIYDGDKKYLKSLLMAARFINFPKTDSVMMLWQNN